MFGNVCGDNSGINRYINGVFVCVCEADASLGKRRSMNVSVSVELVLASPGL